MAELTTNEFSVTDIPMSRTNGDGRRRQMVIVRAETAAGGTDFVDLRANIPGLDTIEGKLFYTVGSAIGAGSAFTWAGGSVITVGEGAATNISFGVVINLR